MAQATNSRGETPEEEHLLNKGYEQGKAHQLAELPRRFRTRAGEEFARGNDKEAFLFRRLADEFEAEATEARKKWLQKHEPARLAKEFG